MTGLASINFSGLGGAVSDIFGGMAQQTQAKGSAAEATAYGRAATIAGQNEAISKQSTQIQEVQAQRSITQTLGGQAADVAGAGLANSGSAVDLMRSSEQQGSLTKQLIQNQGSIQALGYQQEQASYTGMSQAASAAASAEKTSGAGGILGGIVKGIGAVASVAAFL